MNGGSPLRSVKGLPSLFARPGRAKSGGDLGDAAALARGPRGQVPPSLRGRARDMTPPASPKTPSKYAEQFSPTLNSASSQLFTHKTWRAYGVALRFYLVNRWRCLDKGCRSATSNARMSCLSIP